MSGTLYLCATPIGNLEDITYRVVRTLKEVDLIAAEDTRVSGKLLKHFEIQTPMMSYHEHNKASKGPVLIQKLLEGIQIALISDAGTPGISDPGEELVRLCYDAGITVSSLPGACACITALTLSGLSTRSFAYEGFLPMFKKEREVVLTRISQEERTMVFYEAPHRIVKTLTTLCDVLGDRKVSICRELTKLYETAWLTTFTEAIVTYTLQAPKGECVIVVEGLDIQERALTDIKRWQEEPLVEHMEFYLTQGFDKKEAMKQVAKDRGVSRRDVYNELIKDES